MRMLSNASPSSSHGKSERKTRRQPILNVGDFSLVLRQDKTGHKLRFKWCGQRCIIRTLIPLVFFLNHLGSGTQESVHCERHMTYSATLDGTEMQDGIIQLADSTE